MKRRLAIYVSAIFIVIVGTIISCSKTNNEIKPVVKDKTNIYPQQKSVDELLVFYYNEYQQKNRSIWGKYGNG